MNETVENMAARTDEFDRRQIRDLLENWVIWRDSADWERLRTTWHLEGRMVATWTEGTADAFIAVSQAGWDRGVNVLHFLGGSSIELNGDRALAQTKMTISQRSQVDGVLCDVTCTGRFYDFLERKLGRWGLARRRAIYEKDRLDPVIPGTTPILDRTVLEQFPVGYRHLAYLQTEAGYTVSRDLPGTRGPEVLALYGRGAAWLTGGTR